MGFTFSYGTQLQYFAVTVNLTINPFTVDVLDGPKYVEAWETWFNKKVSPQPPPPEFTYMPAYIWRMAKRYEGKGVQVP